MLSRRFFDCVGHLLATGVVEKVLALAILFDIAEPVAASIVVKRAAISYILSKVARIIRFIHLLSKTFLFTQQFLQPILHQKFLVRSLLHHQFFLELT